MVVFITFLLASIFFAFINIKMSNEMKKLASDEAYDEIISRLPSNKEICEEFQNMLGTNCEIAVDDESKSSAYIFFLNKIILSNTPDSKKNFSRILFIAHECVHSVQSKNLHISNFILKNIVNIFTVVLFVLLCMNKITLDICMVYFLISFISFCVNMAMESDAIYRSLILSRRYLEKYNCPDIADRYEYIIPKTAIGMFFRYASFSIYTIFILTISLII